MSQYSRSFGSDSKIEIGDLDQVNTVYLAKSFVAVFFSTVSKITTSSTWQPDSPTV